MSLYIKYIIVLVFMSMNIYVCSGIHNVKKGNWSDPSIWPDGNSPIADSEVEIWYDVEVDIPVKLSKLTIRRNNTMLVNHSTIDVAELVIKENALFCNGNSATPSNVVPIVNLSNLVIEYGEFANIRGVLNADKQVLINTNGVFSGAGISNLKGPSNIEGEEALRNSGKITTSMNIYGNVFNDGNFDVNGRLEERTITFCGITPQHVINRQKMHVVNLVVNNSAGVDVAGELGVKSSLSLVNGVVRVEEGSAFVIEESVLNSNISISNESCFVDGLVIRECSSKGDNLFFPCGEGPCPGFLFVSSDDSEGKALYSVRFHNSKLPKHIDNDALTYSLISTGFWEISNESAELPVRGIKRVELYAQPYSLNDEFYGVYGFSGSSNPYNYFQYSFRSITSANPDCPIGTCYLRSHDLYHPDLIPLYNSSVSKYVFAIGIKPVVISAVRSAIAGGKLINCDNAYTWTGGEGNGKWNSPGNWLLGKVPSATDDVYIKDVFSYGSVKCEIPGVNGKSGKTCTYPVRNYIFNRDYPILKPTDNVSVNDVNILGVNSSLSLNGGTLCVSNIFADTNEDHLIVNNSPDNYSNLFFSSLNNYDKVVVNNTYRSKIFNYVGSATEENSLTTTSLNIRLKNFNPANATYTQANSFSSNHVGSTLALYNGEEENYCTVTQVGTPYYGERNIILVENKWNLISNPFLSTLDLSAAGSIHLSDDVSATAYTRVYDETSRKYVFRTYNIALGLEVSQGDVRPSTGFILAPQQAFFLKALAGSPTVTLSNLISADNNKKQVPNENIVIRVQLESLNSLSDETAVVLGKYGSFDITNLDSYKYFDDAKYDNEESVNQICTFKDNSAMSIPFYPLVKNGSLEIPLGIRMSTVDNKAVLKFSDIDNTNESIQIYLIDKLLNKSVAVSLNTEYQFEASEGSTVNDRFVLSLIFSGTSVDSPLTSKEIVFTRVYDLLGRLIIAEKGNAVLKHKNLQGFFVVESIYSDGTIKRVKSIL